MTELIIDRTLRNVIPALTSQEYEELEKSIVFEGCRDPIIAWNGLIIDGHNRFDICKKNDIPFTIVNKEFNSKKDALRWMISNQLGRRNLTDAQKIELSLKRDEMVGTNVGTCLNPSELTRKDQENIAKELGVSKGNVSKVKKVLDEATDEVKDKMRSGEISINKAEKTTKPSVTLPQDPKPELKQDQKQCPTCHGTGTIKIVKMDIRDVWACPICGRKHTQNLGSLDKCRNCGQTV